MYGSYGSYSSMSAMSAPMDITSNNNRTHDASCAFPSWPRRLSLSDSEQEEPRATSFLSDDDLFLSDPFDDDVRSVSSTSSASSPFAAAVESPPRISEEELLRMERERVAVQREYVRQVKQEKERRRQTVLRARRSSPKKSPKTKSACLTTITETSE
ncbi:hypothetical protein TOPH_01271 [Tolypocladium ophioglossoides CBS 100239]|uniref:Uncharacterized protein n=1 Tax=Tolypocladium ophioglossoides (strain CBS 100239) TaxID=1163406 RepID=A0A0L0NK03_TOLOC|nr:hypothetical protein TOPH_01271 [Tolypocladium ophioglossoides CBS 100239]